MRSATSASRAAPAAGDQIWKLRPAPMNITSPAMPAIAARWAGMMMRPSVSIGGSTAVPYHSRLRSACSSS